MGRFDPRYITHLLLDAPVGSKYENWKAHSDHAWAEKLKVVSSSWVDACEREGRWVEEEGYRLREEGDLDDCEKAVLDAAHHGDGQLDEDARESASSTTQQTTQQRQSLPIDIQHASLEEKCDWMIQQPVDKYCNLFSRQSFIFVGFDNEDNNTTPQNGDGEDYREVDSSRMRVASKLGPSSNNGVPICKNESEKLKGKISKLIRRAGGTIFWEPNEWITNVLLNDNYSKYVW